jgi:hypothetical protein
MIRFVRSRPFGIALGLLLAGALGLAGPTRQPNPAGVRRECVALQPAIGEEWALTEVERITLNSVADTASQAAYVAALMVKYQVGPNVVIDREKGAIRPIGKCLEWRNAERPAFEQFDKRLIRR